MTLHIPFEPRSPRIRYLNSVSRVLFHIGIDSYREFLFKLTADEHTTWFPGQDVERYNYM